MRASAESETRKTFTVNRYWGFKCFVFPMENLYFIVGKVNSYLYGSTVRRSKAKDNYRIEEQNTMDK